MESARDQDHLAPNVSTSPGGGETGLSTVAAPAARPLGFERQFLGVNVIGSGDGSRDLAANEASIH